MGESKKPPEELPLERMVGEMVPKSSDLGERFGIYNEDGTENYFLDKEETNEEKYLMRLELAKQVADQEGIKLGTKIIFDSKKEGVTAWQGTILSFQVNDGNSSILLPKDTIKAGNFDILIESKRYRSDYFVFKDIIEKIKSGEAKVVD